MGDRTTVYFVQGLHGYKIGITNSVRKRLSTFKTANPHVRLIANSAFMERATASWLEQSLHIKYAHKRISGEWFDLGPAEVNEVMEILKGRLKTPVRSIQGLKLSFLARLLGSLILLILLAIVLESVS